MKSKEIQLLANSKSLILVAITTNLAMIYHNFKPINNSNLTKVIVARLFSTGEILNHIDNNHH